MAAERSPETLEDYRVLVNELRAQLVIAEGGSAAQAFKRAWSGIIAREKSKTFGVLRSRWGKAKILEARAREQAKHEEAMEAAKQEKWAAQKREDEQRLAAREAQAKAREVDEEASGLRDEMQTLVQGIGMDEAKAKEMFVDMFQAAIKSQRQERQNSARLKDTASLATGSSFIRMIGQVTRDRTHVTTSRCLSTWARASMKSRVDQAGSAVRHAGVLLIVKLSVRAQKRARMEAVVHALALGAAQWKVQHALPMHPSLARHSACHTADPA